MKPLQQQQQQQQPSEQKERSNAWSCFCRLGLVCWSDWSFSFCPVGIFCLIISRSDYFRGTDCFCFCSTWCPTGPNAHKSCDGLEAAHFNRQELCILNDNIQFYTAAERCKTVISYLCLVLAQACRKGEPLTSIEVNKKTKSTAIKQDQRPH